MANATEHPVGRSRGHEWAVFMATSGHFCWPPVGTNYWPLTKKRLRISSDFEETALDTPITGKFRGKTWIPFISVYDTTFAGAGKNALDAGPLVSHLRTACLIVTAALTGMRPEEVLNLTYGCAQEPLPRPGGSRLQLINGHVYKGVHQQENGSPGEPQPAVWATIPLAASAIQCAERINDSLGRDRGLLFSDSGSRTIYTRTATTWIASFIDFVNARLVPHTESQGALTIPRDPQGAVTLKRFRRTLAWFLRHRPNGDVTTAIQYQHVSVAMGAGYAGTKESGMPDLVLEEDWNHRRKTIQHVGELLSDGKGIAGPAAERALEAVDQLPRELLPADERRLKKDKSLMIYENPAALALCIFREEDALCQKLKRSGRDSQPDLLGCVEGCKNCARTDEHLERLTLKAAGQRKQAELAPLPMAQSLRAEADENDRIVVEFRLTRRTAGRSAQAAAVHAGQGSEEGITADEC